MSDRIGIMRDGRIVQVGTPHEIYNRPVNKFVAQFMGEVNTIEVEAAGEHTVRARADGLTYRVARLPQGFRSGFLIIRPEVMKIGEAAAQLPNRVSGVLFNDYSLGSRIQYQVRGVADGAHWLVERLQDDPFEGGREMPVEIGWRSEDSILVSE